MLKQPTSILLFDGVCNFCNGAVHFIIQRDPKARFCFAALQSEAGQVLLKRYGLQDIGLDTFILIEGQQTFFRTDAALRVARHLSGAWFLAGVFRVVPAAFRDAFYNAFAKRRYRWFGQREVCILPTGDVAKRFIDVSELVDLTAAADVRQIGV